MQLQSQQWRWISVLMYSPNFQTSPVHVRRPVSLNTPSELCLECDIQASKMRSSSSRAVEPLRGGGANQWSIITPHIQDVISQVTPVPTVTVLMPPNGPLPVPYN
jgi:hypothetical protein